MAGMRMSLPGLAKTVTRALRSSPNEMACYSAHSVCELVDNLRTLKDGGCTVEEFFAAYVFDSGSADTKLAAQVKPRDFVCMRDEPDDEADEAAA
jgi:hypothetical protein